MLRLEYLAILKLSIVLIDYTPNGLITTNFIDVGRSKYLHNTIA